MKKIIVSLLFIGLFSFSGATNYNSYLRIHPEGCVNCLAPWFTISNITTVLDVHLVLLERYQTKGHQYITDYLRMDFDEAHVIYSDSLYEALGKKTTENYFVITNATGEIVFETELEKTIDYYDKIYTYAPISNQRSEIGALPDSIFLNNAYIHYSDSLCYIVDIDDFFIMDMANQTAKWQTNHSLPTEKLFFDFYGDTLQYYYVKKNTDFLQGIHKETVTFNSIFSNGDTVYIYSVWPYLTVEGEEGKTRTTISRKVGILVFINGRYDSLIPLNSILDIEKKEFVNEYNNPFLHDNQLYVPAAKLFLFIIPRTKYPYAYFTKNTSEWEFQGKATELIAPLGARATTYFGNFYQDRRLFYTYSNKYYNFDKESYFTIDYRIKGRIHHAATNNNVLKLLYEEDKTYYLLFFKEVNGKCKYLNQFKIPIQSNEVNSNIVFRNFNEVCFLNNSNKLINIKLQEI